MPRKGEKRPDKVEQEGITWIYIGAAARHSRVKATEIQNLIEGGKVQSAEIEDRTFIPFSAANRLKREAATMAAVKRLNAIPNPPPAHNYGVHTPRTDQDVLPMSSGRRGRGWAGQKPDN